MNVTITGRRTWQYLGTGVNHLGTVVLLESAMLRMLKAWNVLVYLGMNRSL
uniref:Uncharacterized protein MANES_16G018800 n=1 Tax=Rhizophora mucronata TaxID=61149 RepID=A0A2P2M7Q6_RHIMU